MKKIITAKSNYLEIITGPMFSGKSTELKRKNDIFKACKKKTQVFKKQEDLRFKDIKIVTHSGLGFNELYPVKNEQELEEALKEDTEVILIDEAQFFSSKIYDIIQKWVKGDPKKKILPRTVIATVLSTDANGNPFCFLDKKRNVGDLLATADFITQCNSKCMYQFDDGSFCHDNATKTFRKTNSKKLVDIGGIDKYTVYCRKHFNEMSLKKSGG